MLGVDEFEAFVFKALEIEPSEELLDSWAISYEKLQSRLTRNRKESLQKNSSAAGEQGAGDIVRGIVHAGRTFRIAQRILSIYPPAAGRMLEVGAGIGPFAFAAHSMFGEPVTILEKNRRMLRNALNLFEAAEMDVPKSIHGDATQPITYRQYSAVFAPFVLNEILTRVESEDVVGAGRKQVKSWLTACRRGGRLYILEPGTKEAAQNLQRLRETLKDEFQIIGPCTHDSECPMLNGEKDWCHVTWRIESGNWAQKIAERAKRRFQDLHFSWLILENRRPQQREPDSLRVMDVRRNDKNKLRVVTCGTSGLETLVVQKKNRATYEAFDDYQSGDELRVTLSQLERKGDGFRVTSEEQIKHRRSVMQSVATLLDNQT
ncbi:MAG: small ribosomal subunit Rsm22 family protein [Myxococcota bacterium]|nr:small ribosomal subunit Rsm22 family protein [Myxococcota bacterium]